MKKREIVTDKIDINEYRLNDFWNECLNISLARIDIYNYIKKYTGNFDENLLIIFNQDLDELAMNIKMFYNEDFEHLIGSYTETNMDELLGSYLYSLEIKGEDITEINLLYKSTNLHAKLEFLEAKYNLIVNDNQLNLYSIAKTELKKVSESKLFEDERLNDVKATLNRRQKIALLESVGVMKYLENNVFAGIQTKMANFLSLIIDFDQQNIRADINKAPELLLKDPKITKVINPILTDLGLRSKE